MQAKIVGQDCENLCFFIPLSRITDVPFKVHSWDSGTDIREDIMFLAV